MIGCAFEKNTAYASGGAIYATTFSYMAILGGSTFSSNKALISGDDVFVQNSKQLVINSTRFQSSYSKNHLNF